MNIHKRVEQTDDKIVFRPHDRDFIIGFAGMIAIIAGLVILTVWSFLNSWDSLVILVFGLIILGLILFLVYQLPTEYALYGLWYIIDVSGIQIQYRQKRIRFIPWDDVVSISTIFNGPCNKTIHTEGWNLDSHAIYVSLVPLFADNPDDYNSAILSLNAKKDITQAINSASIFHLYTSFREKHCVKLQKQLRRWRHAEYINMVHDHIYNPKL